MINQLISRVDCRTAGKETHSGLLALQTLAKAPHVGTTSTGKQGCRSCALVTSKMPHPKTRSKDPKRSSSLQPWELDTTRSLSEGPAHGEPL